MDKKLIEKCISLYHSGGSRMDVSRLLMNELGIKKSAAKVRAKTIWDNHFEEDYVPVSGRGEDGDDIKEYSGVMKDGSSKLDVKDENHAMAESKSDNVRTLDDLLRVCEVDLDYWEVERHIINKWEVAAKDEDGILRHAPLYQVKAWLKKREVKNAQEIVDYFNQALSQISPKSQPRNKGGKYMYEVSIPDLHLSKLSWEPESGQDYNIKIAVELFKDACAALISKINLEEVDKLILPIGNDFFNSEGYSSSTTAGTLQHEDSRWQKSFSIGCNLVTEVVDELAKDVNVEIVLVPGNHDMERNYYLGEFLRAWYKNSEAVTVNNSPTTRKYVEFGENLILFTHGNEEKQTELPLLMATEHPSFSKCKYRTVHLGHLHMHQLKEDKGVTVRVLPSLCAADSWHSKKAYVNNRRAAMGFLYDPEYGEVANYFYNIS